MTGAKFERLVEIMKALRGPDGCPWDRQQDLKSLQPMLIEELYEVVEAVDNEDFTGLAEELGDLLLHVVFHAELGSEMQRFDIDDVLEGIAEKLVRRHPHVFGGETAAHADEALQSWERAKREEKVSDAPTGVSVLDGIPPRLPALYEAHKISSRVARHGFDWETLADVIEKLREETSELECAAALNEGETRRREVEAEIGDMLFVVVNIARHVGVDSEAALKRSNRKFTARFRQVEELLSQSGRTLREATQGELEVLWQAAKARELDEA